MNCRKCGSLLKPEDKFCLKCGESVEKAENADAIPMPDAFKDSMNNAGKVGNNEEVFDPTKYRKGKKNKPQVEKFDTDKYRSKTVAVGEKFDAGKYSRGKAPVESFDRSDYVVGHNTQTNTVEQKTQENIKSTVAVTVNQLHTTIEKTELETETKEKNKSDDKKGNAASIFVTIFMILSAIGCLISNFALGVMDISVTRGQHDERESFSATEILDLFDEKDSVTAEAFQKVTDESVYDIVYYANIGVSAIAGLLFILVVFAVSKQKDKMGFSLMFAAYSLIVIIKGVMIGQVLFIKNELESSMEIFRGVNFRVDASIYAILTIGIAIAVLILIPIFSKLCANKKAEK